MYSVFTNNVEEPILDETTFLPETNVSMVYLSIFKVLEVTRSLMQKHFMRTIDTTIELLAGVGDNNIGVIMENFYFQHLSLRLQCAHLKRSKVSLVKLLGWEK